MILSESNLSAFQVASCCFEITKRELLIQAVKTNTVNVNSRHIKNGTKDKRGGILGTAILLSKCLSHAGPGSGGGGEGSGRAALQRLPGLQQIIQ